MSELSEHVKHSLAQQEQYLNLHAAILARAGASLGAALARGNKLLAVGCPVVAEHLVAEITGRYMAERPGLPAVALCENPSAVTAIWNDYGREQIYARQLSALVSTGDFVLGFMAGTDHAAYVAIDQAQKLGMETLALEIPDAEESIATETFLTAVHMLCDAAEAELMRQKPEWFPLVQ
jgi:D-sedoheptulose 7-phosphate isomerase